MSKKKLVVIGAGLAGVTIANDMSAEYDVAVLEKGPGNGYKLPINNYIDRPFGDNSTYCYGVGGTTHLWHNGLISLNAGEVEGGLFRSMLKDSNRFKDRAANALNFKGDYSSERQIILDYYKDIIQNIGVKAKVDTILIPKHPPLLKVNNAVKVYSEVDAIEFEFNHLGSVNKVSFDTLEGGEVLNVDHLVICAGGCGSHKVHSDLLRAVGHSDIDIRVGHGLMDHPMGFIGKVKIKKQYMKQINKFCHKNDADFTSRGGIVLSDEGFNHIVYLRPSITMTNSFDLNKFKSALASTKGFKRIKFLFDPRLYHPDILSEIYSYLTGRSVSSKIYTFWVVFEQKRNNTRYVKSSNIENVINWGINDAESSLYDGVKEKLSKIFSNVASEVTFMEGKVDEVLWSAAHHSGTTLIDEFAIGAVDSNLCVNGVNNAYVCDGSVISSHSYANTGLTIAQLAIRLAEHIRKIDSAT